jgi:hypothetical protein
MTKRITPNQALLQTGTRRASRRGPSIKPYAAGVFNAKCQVPVAEVDRSNESPSLCVSAPLDGVVDEIHVALNDTVESKDLLVTLRS